MLRVFFTSLLLVSALPVILLAATTRPVTAKWFNSLSDDDRFAVVSAALKARDAALQNFSIDLSQQVVVIHDDKHNRRFPPTQYTGSAEDQDVQKGVKQSILWSRSTVLKRKGKKLLIHDQQFKRDGSREFEFWMNWDGSTYRKLNAPGQHRGWEGGIADAEPKNFGALEYDVLLGLRAWRQPITMPQWLDKVAKAHTIREIAAQEEQGRTLIVVHVVPYGISNRRFWLDPARGYMPVRYDIRSVDNDGIPHDWATYWVREAKNMGDVWVPMRVVGRMTIAGSDYGYDQYKFDVSKFEIGTVMDDDMKIVFPSGTKVVDRTKRVAFKITDAGGHQPMPLYDPATGMITLNGEKVDQVLANAKAPFHARSHWWWTVALLAGVVLIVAAAVMIWRKRLRAQPS